jgi:hypothetical protein
MGVASELELADQETQLRARLEHIQADPPREHTSPGFRLDERSAGEVIRKSTFSCFS